MGLRTNRLLLGMALAAGAAPGFAIQRGYLVDSAARPGAIANPALEATRFSIYFDPIYTNWVGWSQIPETVEQDGVYKIGDDGKPAGLLDGYVVMTLVDPDGRRSGAYVFDDNDAQGNPVGRQAVVYGSSKESPNVFRTNKAGEKFELDEGGETSKFFDRGGKGYYSVELKYVGRNPSEGHGPVYLVMDVVEGFEPFPPVANVPNGAAGGWLNGEPDGKHGNGHNSGLKTGTIIDPPHFPPDSPFPPPPVNNEPDPDDTDPEPNPVVPEPATVALIGMGLAGLAAARRKRV